MIPSLYILQNGRRPRLSVPRKNIQIDVFLLIGILFSKKFTLITNVCTFLSRKQYEKLGMNGVNNQLFKRVEHTQAQIDNYAI